MPSHGPGSCRAGRAVMPWPVTSRVAHSAASCPGTGLSADSAPHAWSAAMASPRPVGAAGERLGWWHGRVKPDLVREGQGQQEQPVCHVVQQVLAGAGARLAGRYPGAVWRPVPGGQADARACAAGGDGEIQPAGAWRRAGIEGDLAGQFVRTPPAAAPEARPVAGAVVVGRGELVHRGRRRRAGTCRRARSPAARTRRAPG